MSEERFSKVHGPNAISPETYLRRENAELKNQVAQMNQEMMMRAAPRVGELIDSINQLLAELARRGSPQAKEGLRLLFKALDGARAAHVRRCHSPERQLMAMGVSTPAAGGAVLKPKYDTKPAPKPTPAKKGASKKR